MNAFSPLRGSELRKSFLLSENVKKAKIRLWSKNVARKDLYAFIEGKRGTENRKRVYPLKTCLPSGNTCTQRKRGSHWNKRVNRTKTWLIKAKTCLSKKTCPGKASLAKAKTRLPSKNVAHKSVYAFIEGKRSLQNRKRFYPAKTSLTKSKTRLPSKPVA